MPDLRGIFPPLPTPFDDDENIDIANLKNNIEILSRFELEGFLVLGSNGELVNLSEDEIIEVYNVSRSAIPSNKLMLAGAGAQSTRQTIKLCRAASAAGADAVLVLNPSYYKGLMGKEALRKHYFEIADASPVPVIIYNMPASSGIDMDADTIISISGHGNIIGLKDSGGNIAKMGNIIHNSGDDFQVLAGSAGFLLPALAMGARGGILALANIAPTQCVNIYKLFIQSDLEGARRNQLELIEINNAVTRKWGVPALKFAMDSAGLYGGLARRPALPLDEKVKEELLSLMNKAGIGKIDT
jgi:4-hydroxy-2-oxoglutarate aldolase